LSVIEKDARLGAQYSALSQAAGLAATPQLRNMATIGGNLVQRPRCWYFRSPLFMCWLKGGSECQAREGENALHAIFDESPCVAVHPSDPAVALVALDASVQTTSRALPISEFLTLPRDDHRQESVLRSDELIVSLTLPSLSDGWRSTYCKAMNRQVWAFALVSVAAALRVEAGKIADARLVLGGVAPIPWRAHEAERLLVGNAASEDVFSAAAAAAVADARPLSHNAYKTTLAQGMIRQALAALTQEQSS
jgi:xanthine dehydrogenase YagS FAD-binding subunit